MLLQLPLVVPIEGALLQPLQPQREPRTHVAYAHLLGALELVPGARGEGVKEVSILTCDTVSVYCNLFSFR